MENRRASTPELTPDRLRSAGSPFVVSNHLNAVVALSSALAWILLFTAGRTGRIPIAIVLAMCGLVALRLERREVAVIRLILAS